jgi:hypothetical protein
MICLVLTARFTELIYPGHHKNPSKMDAPAATGRADFLNTANMASCGNLPIFKNNSCQRLLHKGWSPKMLITLPA